MALFNPGLSSIKATTYEGALIEGFQILRSNLSVGARTLVDLEISEEARTVGATVTIPLLISQSSDGTLNIQADDETSPGYTWAADATSDASAASLAAQILAIAAKINMGVEKPSINAKDRCQLSISTDTATATIVCEFQLTDRPAIPILVFGVADYIQDF
jgi:hypothetical protein